MGVSGVSKLETRDVFKLKLLATAKALQSCPTLHDPIDGSPPGSSANGIFQARVLDWVAIAFSDN